MSKENDGMERVEVWSLDPARKLGEGSLALGDHGFPVLWSHEERLCAIPYTPWSVPATWYLRALAGQAPRELLSAWSRIQEILSELAVWSRRHDGMGREETTKEVSEDG